MPGREAGAMPLHAYGGETRPWVPVRRLDLWVPLGPASMHEPSRREQCLRRQRLAQL